MPFTLPPTFKEVYGTFHRAVIDAQIPGKDQVGASCRAMTAACDLLHLVDLESFKVSVTEIYEKAKHDPKWVSRAWQDMAYFNEFLHVFEAKILSQRGFSSEEQERMCMVLKDSRLPAARLATSVNTDPKTLAEITTGALLILKKDVCRVAEEQKQQLSNSYHLSNDVRIIGGVTALVNASAAVLPIPPFAIAMSALIGGVAALIK